MIAMARVVERVFTLRRREVVDPSQPLSFDEIVIETETVNDEIFRRPANGGFEIAKVRQEAIRNMQPTGIMIAAVKQDARLSLSLPFGEPAHHRRAAVNI